MPNMSYCRFQNTLTDLQDCQEALEEEVLAGEDLSESERRAAKRLIRVCGEIDRDFGAEV